MQTLVRILKRWCSVWMAERTKLSLRAKLMALPVTKDYPFDVEAKLLRAIGIPRSVMLDVGANTGIYSALFEDVVGSENLYLFEPLPYLQQYLKKRFPKAHVCEFALSEKQDTQILRVPYINGKRYDSRATFNNHAESGQTGFDEFEVRFFPLDTVAKQTGFDAVGFLKIDVEGHELEVLNGAVETITRFKPLILIEIEARHHQFPISEIFSKFEELGYKGYYVNPETLELLNVAQFESERDQNQKWLKSRNFFLYLNNFIFVHGSAEKDFVAKALSFLESEKRLVT